MKDELREEVVKVLTILREDAEMALSGEWDCGTDEGKKTGFTAQIELIDSILDKMK